MFYKDVWIVLTKQCAEVSFSSDLDHPTFCTDGKHQCQEQGHYDLNPFFFVVLFFSVVLFISFYMM